MQDKKITKGGQLGQLGRIGHNVMLQQNLLWTDQSVFCIRSHNKFYQGTRNKELRKTLNRRQSDNGES